MDKIRALCGYMWRGLGCVGVEGGMIDGVWWLCGVVWFWFRVVEYRKRKTPLPPFISLFPNIIISAFFNPHIPTYRRVLLIVQCKTRENTI